MANVVIALRKSIGRGQKYVSALLKAGGIQYWSDGYQKKCKGVEQQEWLD
jgi:hypothetical protein